MEDLHIKRVTLAEVDQLQRISRKTFYEAFSDVNTPENMNKYLNEGFALEKLTAELSNPDSQFYFAMHGNDIVGYLKLNSGQSQTDIKDDHSLEIERIYVLKEFHGKQVAQLLYGKALQIARQQNAGYIWLGVWEQNPRAISFYRKNGFVEFDKHSFMLGDDEQTDIMMRREMNLNKHIEDWLAGYGTDFVRFVDISDLPEKQNRGYRNAVFFGVKSTPAYINHVAGHPDYVKDAIADGSINHDEHYLQEMEMYRISDLLAQYLSSRGHDAYSLSDDNQIADSAFDAESIRTYLPLKTLAVKAGIGWIGKHALLITPERGCGQHMGAVLTDAPVVTVNILLLKPRCGSCRKCVDVCVPGALKGQSWSPEIDRDDMLEVPKCTTCLQCFVHCPWTQRYARQRLG